MRNFPIQTIPSIQKDKKWFQSHLDYAQVLLYGRSGRIEELTESFNGFNGIKTKASEKRIAAITKTHGIENRSKYVSYRAHKTKIQVMVGEFLVRPLAATVETINKEAKSAKMRQMDFWYGAMIAKPELEHLRDKVGVDVMEGAPIPSSEEDPLWQKMSPKDKEEEIMQIILNEQIPNLDLKQKFSEGLLNCAITAEIFGKIERDQEGDTNYINIDPRDAIFEEIKGDTFLEKSPIMGCRQWMSVHDVLRRYRFTPDQVKMLEDVASNPQNYYSQYGNSIRPNPTGGVIVEVIHIEWKSVMATYYKRMPKTQNQLLFDSSEKYIEHEIDAKQYEENKAWYDKQVEKGKFEIMVKYAEDLLEATRIGGIKELDMNLQRCQYQMRRVDNPAKILSGSYVGYLCNTVDGKRISMFNEMENWSNMFDITMYQILKELNKYKGTILGFNTAALGAKKSLKSLAYDMVNDSIVTYDTAAPGNFHGKDVSLNNILQTFDLGFSASFPTLVQFKNDILSMMDKMTGINEAREGNIMASSTATNAQINQQASRTITEPFFYGIYLFINKTLMKIVESTKVTWAFYKIEKGEQILGTDKWKWLQVTQELGFKDYGVHLQDGGKYAETKRFMEMLLQASLNSRELRPEDALKFALSETFSEQTMALKDGWAKVKEIGSQMQQQTLDANSQSEDKRLKTQLQLAQEDREDKQKAKMDEIEWTATNDIRVNDAKAGNKIIENQHKIDSESQNNMFI